MAPTSRVIGACDKKFFSSAWRTSKFMFFENKLAMFLVTSAALRHALTRDGLWRLCLKLLRCPGQACYHRVDHLL